MLKQGENTYATLAEADEYVAAYNNKYAPLRVIWSVLDDEEKESYMRNSLTEIEALPFVGRKYLAAQKLAFPRIKPGAASSYCRHPLMAVWAQDYSEIPQEIKEAQVENALALIGKECMAQTDKQFMIMQSLGIMKNIKYNKREAGDVGMGDDIKGTSGNGGGLTSKAAYNMLRGWLGALRV